MNKDNKSLIMGLLKDNYSSQITDINFPFTLHNIMENIYNQREQFTGLMEMNKTLLMECARLFNKKNPRDIFDMRLREKTNEFNNFTKSAPPEIDFTDSRTFNASDNVDDLLTQQIKERRLDAELFKNKNKKAEAWVNNEIPPKLNIGGDIKEDLFPQKIVEKKVTFKSPLEEPPVNSLFTKLKRTTIPKTQHKSFCIRPNEIQGNKMLFTRNLGTVKTITISKLFLHEIVQSITNPLDQRIFLALSNEPFIIFTIIINGTIQKENLLFIKKMFDGKNIFYETDEKIVVNDQIKRIEIKLFNKENTGINVPMVPQITNYINGKKLEVGEHTQFKNPKFTYLIMENNLLLPGEVIMNENVSLKIMGTCQLELDEGKYYLRDITDTTKHNTAIVIEENESYSLRHLSRLPVINLNIEI